MDDLSVRSSIDLSVTEFMFISGCLAAASAQVCGRYSLDFRKNIMILFHRHRETWMYSPSCFSGGGGHAFKISGKICLDIE